MNTETVSSPETRSQSSSEGVSPEALWTEAFSRAPRTGISFSEGAAAFAKQKLEKRGTPDAAVRVGIKGGGCSGFSYVIQFDDAPPKARDYAYEVSGARFIVDKKSFVYLAGSTLDYEKTLMFQGFKFRNPNEATNCGCGHSFTVK
jgi:iron-sulfur cluster assembly protein